MPGLGPGIHDLLILVRGQRRGWPGHRRAEATPSFRRLCPAMTARELARASPIQRLVPAEDPLLVERDPPVAGQIGFDVRARRNAVAQFDETGNFALESLHAFRKCIAKSL